MQACKLLVLKVNVTNNFPYWREFNKPLLRKARKTSRYSNLIHGDFLGKP
jgi:hypothetical protein